MPTAAEILKIALELTPEERLRLAQDIFDQAQTPEENEIEQEWLAVAEQRIDEIEAGTAKLIPADESIARARAALKNARRASRRG